MLALHGLAPVEGDGFAVFAHPHQVVAEVALALLLFEVQPRQRAADELGDDAARQAVQHGHPHHEAGNLPLLAIELEAEGPRQPPQNAHKAAQRDHCIQQAHAQAHRIAGEEVEVFGHALVGVVGVGGLVAGGKAQQFHAVKGLVGQPAVHEAGRPPGPPAHFQQLGQVELVDRNHDVATGQPCKAPQLLPERTGILVLQRIVEQAVPVGDEHQHEGRKDDARDRHEVGPCLDSGRVDRHQTESATRSGPWASTM